MRLRISKEGGNLEAAEALDGINDTVPSICQFAGVKVFVHHLVYSLPVDIIPIALADGVSRVRDRDLSLPNAKKEKAPRLVIAKEAQGEDSYVLKWSYDEGNPFCQRVEQYWKEGAKWWTKYVRYFEGRIDMEVELVGFEHAAP